MATTVTYGVGGFDPSKPNNNVISTIDVADDATPDPLSVLVEALATAVDITDVQAAAATAQAAIDAAP